ncbi:MAG: hypothetical protein ACTSSI_08400 [Candidatus Helarchaeota archaeon]
MGKKLKKSRTNPGSYDIVDCNVKKETVKVLEIDTKTGKKSTRTYTLSSKHGMAPKRIRRQKKVKKVAKRAKTKRSKKKAKKNV